MLKWPQPRSRWKRSAARSRAAGNFAAFALGMLETTKQISPLTAWQRKYAVALLQGSKPPAGSGNRAAAEAAAGAARGLRL